MTLRLESADRARDLLREVEPLGTERVGLAEASGRVIAVDHAATEDMPPWPRSTMDGYAVRAGDTTHAGQSVLRVQGTVPMGGTWPGTIGPGEAVAISTGGAIPAGADAVIMVEHVQRSGDQLTLTKSVAPGANLLGVGEDLRRGDRLVQHGRRLRAQDIAVLAAYGHVELTVYRRPVVGILSTGNEVVPPDATPAPGQVRDMNQYALAAQCREAGAEVLLGGLVGDDADQLAARLAELAARTDMLLLSGGSSVGTRDVTAIALERLGATVVFHGIDVRPGKPTIFARAGTKLLFGMPGVPVSAMVIFDAFVRPVVWALGGESGREPFPERVHAVMGKHVPSAPGREDYVRVTLSGEGPLYARPLPGGSNSVSTLLHADGLVVIPASAAGIGEGEPVEVLLYA